MDLHFGKAMRTGARRALPRGWHQAFAALALILFAFQSYVTQTHVHLLWQGAPERFADAPGGAGHLTRQTPSKRPPADNPATCPLCQGLLLSGHFTSPGGIVLLLPHWIGLSTAILAAVPALVAAASHSWYGRAPPRA